MAVEKWILPEQSALAQELSKQLHIRPVTAAVMISRGIDTWEKAEKYLHPDVSSLHDPALLLGAKEAAQLIGQKITDGKSIRIIGDYDIDGVCATYILYDTIRELGGKADWDIPDRIEDGYGLNVHLIEKAKADGIDTIITCDNGIAAIDAIRLAKSYQMTVVLTDHHAVPTDEDTGEELLPPADVIVDPHRKGETYPYPDICGAVVAWKVMQLLYRIMGYPRRILHNLSMAAFATIGDVMDLQDENRVLVYYGLQALTRTENPGLAALIRLTGVMNRTSRIGTYAVGFILGPCINAAGRLDTARQSVQLLLEKNNEKAEMLAANLIALNTERQDQTKAGVEAARELAETEPHASDRVLLLYLPDSSESIVGIIAGKVRESTGKPVFVLTPSKKDPHILKGSGRSIEEYNMFEQMQRCRDLYIGGGGHPMAAGITLTGEQVEPLRIKLNELCGLTEEDTAVKVRIDAMLAPEELSENLIEELERIEPCGKGNEKPLFAALGLDLLEVRIMGARRNAVRLKLSSGRSIVQGLIFCDGDTFTEELQNAAGAEKTRLLLTGRGRGLGVQLDAAYVPQINEFRGDRTLQMLIKHYRFIDKG